MKPGSADQQRHCSSSALSGKQLRGTNRRNLHHASEVAIEAAAVAEVHECSEHIYSCASEKGGENHFWIKAATRPPTNAGAAIELPTCWTGWSQPLQTKM